MPRKAQMRSDDLVVGNTCFMLTYLEPESLTPVIISYRYLGKDLGGAEADAAQ